MHGGHYSRLKGQVSSLFSFYVNMNILSIYICRCLDCTREMETAAEKLVGLLTSHLQNYIIRSSTQSIRNNL